MAKMELDRGKLCAHFRKLRKEDLLRLLDRDVNLLPGTRLPALVEGCLDPADLKPAGTSGASLRTEVTDFRDASMAGEYYEDFDVNSKNFMELSRGTEAWIAECNRLFDRCREVAGERPDAEVGATFEILFRLLRHIDECHDDVIFFADEGGAWQVGVRWREVLPAYFKTLAADTGAEEYARAVVGVIEEFDDYDRKRHLRDARAVASPGQKRALRGA